MESIISLGLGLVSTVVKLIENAKTATAEQHAEILASLQEAETALAKAQKDAHAVVDEETKKTEDAIKAAGT